MGSFTIRGQSLCSFKLLAASLFKLELWGSICYSLFKCLQDACKVAEANTSLVGNLSSVWKLHGDIQVLLSKALAILLLHCKEMACSYIYLLNSTHYLFLLSYISLMIQFNIEHQWSEVMMSMA